MPSPIAPDMIYELVAVSEPSLSPDGSRLAFVRSQVDRETMESRSQIMMMSPLGGDAVPFTGGRRDSGPRFGPDGRTLAFLRSDDAGTRHLWLIPVSGGEAQQLTTSAGGVQGFAWSPDSRHLVFVSDVDPDRPPEGHDPAKDPRVRVVRRIRYRADTVGWRGDAFRHLFIVDTQTGETRQLTDGEGDDSSPRWSPDGSSIAFFSDRARDRDLVPYTDAYVVPAGGGTPECWSEGLSSVDAITWSPASRRLAVTGSHDDEVGAGWQGWIFVLEPAKAPLRLTDDSIKPAAGYAPIIPPPEIAWTEDGRIVLLADRHGESYLYEVDVNGGTPQQVEGGGSQLSGATFDAKARYAVALSVPPTSSGHLRLIDIPRGSHQVLTDYNAGYFDDHPPARLEKFTISRAGAKIESRLFFPPGFESTGRYPLIVDIHGGPHGAFYDAFNPVQQVLATHGYIVLAVNPRGSSTYGRDFLKAVMRDWGGEDYLDIMAALDEVSSRPYVDADRLGVTGYSYGGFMSSWIIGHDTRFNAAVVGAPCINLSSMYGTSDIGVIFGEPQWGGMRKDALDVFLERSPLTYAPNVETPVLLMHGEDDARCPIEQSEQYFVALKRLGKEVELVRFPGSSHSLLRSGHPRMREEYLTRCLAWFDTHLGIGVAESARTETVPAEG